MSETPCVHVAGARVNNLKNVTLDIPRNKLVVITGLSGSGKSSLAFNTLYAEGQRRYVESLNSYARQFLGRMGKPECDFITGLPPAIAIEQKVISRNPRSTVGTSTEVYDYLRLLFARIGKTYSPISGQEVRKHTPEHVVQCMLSYTPGTRFTVVCPICLQTGRTMREQLEQYLKEGYTRVQHGSEVIRIDDLLATAGDLPTPLNLLIDRLSVSDEKDNISRLVDSAETAFYEGHGQMALHFLPSGIEHSFSTRFEADGITFEEPSDQLFAFNSPMGACPTCEGWGNTTGIDPHLVVPDTSKSVYDGCVQCWRGEKMGQWRTEFIRMAEDIRFPIFTPYYDLTPAERHLLWHGRYPDCSVEERWQRHDVCIDLFFDNLREGRYKIQNRVMLARYTGKTECPSCRGSRLRPEATYVKVGGKAITELVDMPISDLKVWFDHLVLTDHEHQVAKRLLTEIGSRLQFLLDVGLGYLTLGRRAASLSGGESQRIHLATSLGSSLVGSMYILDEPSIGLHSRDTQRLIHVLRQLVDIGNTVIVVEHDEEMIRAADYIIDIGPDAGRLGGEVVWQGDNLPPAVAATDAIPDAYQPFLHRSHTLQWLFGLTPLEAHPLRSSNRSILVRGARANNLCGIDVRFPLHVMTCVTGVSGSGKSSLVRDVLFRALKRHLDQVTDHPGEFIALEGDLDAIQAVEFVDQNPIGKSSRSNPVIYVKAYDDIRRLFADQPLSRQLGFTASHFSFNTEGGRCEECKGEGTITIEMQFMADLVLQCDACHGKRFKNDILDVRFADKNITDVLDMTVNQALEFFTLHGETKIVSRLKPLQDVGLGYIKLGQSSSTLSGGENQRVKLAYYIGMEKQVPTLFIFDEPTTGLHYHDIRRLLASFDALIARGHTIVVIEHNLDVIAQADHIIDLGPEGGAKGGHLVVAGAPADVAACPESYTGRFLAAKMQAAASRNASIP